MAGFLPTAGPGQVLITSPNSHWPGKVLQVPRLDVEVAADFLISRTGDPHEQAAAELAGELEGMPLALEQAVAYMQSTGQSLAGYLALFRDAQRADPLGPGEPTGYSRTVATTWALAFGHLEKSPGAVALLRLLAFCAPEAIPLRLMLQSSDELIKQLGPAVAPMLVPLLEDPVAIKYAVAALRRYSLVAPDVDGRNQCPAWCRRSR